MRRDARGTPAAVKWGLSFMLGVGLGLERRREMHRAVICAISRGRCPSSARSRAGEAPHLRDLADHHGGERGLGEGEATLVAGGRRRLVRGRGCGKGLGFVRGRG